MTEIIGYSAYNVWEDAYEYNENECYIADSIESLRDFIKGAGFSVEDFRAVTVQMSDIMDDYGASIGRYCMEPEALKRFEKMAHSTGRTYSLEDYCEGLVNVEVDLSCKANHLEKTHEKTTKAAHASKIQKTDAATIINFSSQKNRFLIFKQICTNPSCPGNDILLSFVEVNDRLKPVTNPLSFTINLDLDTGKEMNPPERPETVNRLVEEYLKNLTEEMKADLLSEIHSIKNDEKRIAEYRLDMRDVLEGVLVSYTDIVSDKGSITRGGREVSFRFIHKGHEYFVEDLYCPNPECRCKEVHLQFFELTREFTGSTRIIDCFMAKISFKGGMQISELFKTNIRDAKDLIEAWKIQYSDVLGVLKDRYKKIKKVGKQSLNNKRFRQISESFPKPAIIKRKIGRNEPCPCGSGKKYKKCCGSG